MGRTLCRLSCVSLRLRLSALRLTLAVDYRPRSTVCIGGLMMSVLSVPLVLPLVRRLSSRPVVPNIRK